MLIALVALFSPSLRAEEDGKQKVKVVSVEDIEEGMNADLDEQEEALTQE